jgi:hypothetical protein
MQSVMQIKDHSINEEMDPVEMDLVETDPVEMNLVEMDPVETNAVETMIQ